MKWLVLIHACMAAVNTYNVGSVLGDYLAGLCVHCVMIGVVCCVVSNGPEQLILIDGKRVRLNIE